MNRGYNVTMLEDLPDLEDLERNNHQQQPQQEQISNEKLKKFIRGNHKMDPMAGMENNMRSIEPQYIDNQQYRQPPQQMFREQQPINPVLNCIDVARHIQDCPICSRFYNNDKTVYIVVIVLLLIICILLLKRVLNV
jgi:hypothetical protein